jgi:hypothetical protein
MDANKAHDGEPPQAPLRLNEWRVERVAFDSPADAERMSDARPRSLAQVLATMLREALVSEEREGVE